MRSFYWTLVALIAIGCGDDGGAAGSGGSSASGGSGGAAGSGGSSASGGSGGAAGSAMPPASADPDRDIISTDLSFDLASQMAEATIQLAPATSTGATFEVEGLTVLSVQGPGGPLNYRVSAGKLDVGVPADGRLTLGYRFRTFTGFRGLSPAGWTFIWPYYCGNLFPCHSSPADGLRMTLAVSAPLSSGMRLVYPTVIPADAPSYMLAWASGAYAYSDLGITRAGTRVGAWILAGDEAAAASGTTHLKDYFDWYEQNLGPYSFGSQVAVVDVDWGGGSYGGMEHHPFWHVGSADLSEHNTQAHEPAHGWYGNGIRLRCWEDFVLSEGTVSYLAARVIGAVEGTSAEQAEWTAYQNELTQAVQSGDTQAWPTGCNQINIVRSGLDSLIPYMKGAFFYKRLEDALGGGSAGQAAVLSVLARFYQARKGGAAGMQDMLDAIRSDTGFDPTPLADTWLRGLGIPQ
jgi:hypothetical protein